MVNYIELNVNPMGCKTSDCVVRALSKASGQDYWEVAKGLFEIYLERGHTMNEKRTYELWLKENGFVKYKQPKKANGLKYKVGEIDKLVKQDRACVVVMANHMSSIVDGILFDIWDCRFKTINNYYVKLF